MAKNRENSKVNNNNEKVEKEEKVLPERMKKIKDDWDNKRHGGNTVAISDPVTNSFVLVTRLIVEDNRVSVWTGDYDNESPEYVIVNPPTQYPSGDSFVEDPMTAIAISILSAKK